MRSEGFSLYDMIHPNADDTFTVRSVFIIGSIKGKVILTYPALHWSKL
jgi:alkyl hydroperoxide reductase subunit AhpC